jgi:hypothetical protein
MCLDTRYPPEVEKKMIAKLPEEFVVYKVVDRDYIGYKSLIFWSTQLFKIGVNKARTKSTAGIGDSKYNSGFHSFKTRLGIKRFHQKLGWSTYPVIKAKVRREWVTAIGKQCGYQVIVSRKIIMPSPDDEKARVA